MVSPMPGEGRSVALCALENLGFPERSNSLRGYYLHPDHWVKALEFALVAIQKGQEIFSLVGPARVPGEGSRFDLVTGG